MEVVPLAFARRKLEGLRPEVRKLRFAHEEDVDRTGATAAFAHGAHDERLAASSIAACVYERLGGKVDPSAFA